MKLDDYAKPILEIFLDFLNQSFNFEIDEITYSLIYVSKFFTFIPKCVYEIPITVQMAAEDDVEINNVSFINYNNFIFLFY